jgi:hypothetical protein
MTKSITKLVLTQGLKKLLKSTNPIKILNKDGKTFVNNLIITERAGVYYITNVDVTFFSQKSAVAYAICIENKDNDLAKEIKEKDFRFNKLLDDMFYFKWSLKQRRDNFKRAIMLNRISDIKPKLKLAECQLNQSLKRVKIA